jgi:hypothetical protein
MCRSQHLEINALGGREQAGVATANGEQLQGTEACPSAGTIKASIARRIGQADKQLSSDWIRQVIRVKYLFENS